jgi:hypothetical protein
MEDRGWKMAPDHGQQTAALICLHSLSSIFHPRFQSANIARAVDFIFPSPIFAIDPAVDGSAAAALEGV